MADLSLPIDYTSLSSKAAEGSGGEVQLTQQLIAAINSNADLVQFFTMNNPVNFGENTEGATDLDNFGAPVLIDGLRSIFGLDLPTDSFIAKKSVADWSIANVWSVMILTKQNGADINEAYFQFGDSLSAPFSTPNAFKFVSNYIFMRDSAGTMFKFYENVPVSADTTLWILTWGGTNLTLYKDGVDITGSLTKTTDNAGTMTNTMRDLYICAATNDGGTVMTEQFDGKVELHAVFDVELSQAQATAFAALTTIYSGSETYLTSNLSFGTTLTIDPRDIGVRIDSIAADGDVTIAYSTDNGGSFSADFDVDQAGGTNGLYFIKTGPGGTIDATQILLRVTLNSDGPTARVGHTPIVRNLTFVGGGAGGGSIFKGGVFG